MSRTGPAQKPQGACAFKGVADLRHFFATAHSRRHSVGRRSNAGDLTEMNLAHVWTVLRKEVVDNFRDRRTLLSALLIGPLFGPLLLTAMVNLTVSTQLGQLDEPLDLPVASAERAPNLVAYLRNNNVNVLDAPDDPERSVREGEVDLVLIIPEAYPEHFRNGLPAPLKLVADHSNSQTEKSVRKARSVIAAYNRSISVMRLQARGVNSYVLAPVMMEDIDVSTAAGRALLILGMFTYFLLIAVLTGGMYLAIDTTAGERERGSLESLLTLPVARSDLILGKIGATCSYMTLSLLLTLLSMYVTIPFIPLQRLNMSPHFPIEVVALIFVLMLPFVLFGAALLTVFAAFTKSYKEAQTYLGLVILVPTLPIVFASILSLRPQLETMAVPALGQHFIVSSLMRAQPLEASFYAVSVISTTLAGILMVLLVMHRYRSEGLLG